MRNFGLSNQSADHDYSSRGRSTTGRLRAVPSFVRKPSFKGRQLAQALRDIVASLLFGCAVGAVVGLLIFVITYFTS